MIAEPERFAAGSSARWRLKDFPKARRWPRAARGAKAQLLALRPDLQVVGIRGNVATRLQKLAAQREMDATDSGGGRVGPAGFHDQRGGRLKGDAVPEGLLARDSGTGRDAALRGPGRGGIGDAREDDDRMADDLRAAESFQHAPMRDRRARISARRWAADARARSRLTRKSSGSAIHLRAVAFLRETPRRGEAKRTVKEAAELGAAAGGGIEESGVKTNGKVYLVARGRATRGC